MNTPPEPINPPPSLPSLPSEAGFALILETLLKRPAQLIDTLHRGTPLRSTAILATMAFFLFAAYGFLMGTFSGGSQLLSAALKVSLGSFAAALICLPSLFIFTCLTGASVTLRSLTGLLASVLALTALLLIGFAPVAWVFSQSTESLAFMGTLHLVFWLVSLAFGLRLIRVMLDLLGVKGRSHLHVWTVIFILVNLQMSTALRPIIGTAKDILPREKKFFLTHWFDNLASDESR